MGIRKIREIGDEVLTKQCKEVTKMSLRTKILNGDMLDTMYEAMGVGLAAPQVGVLKRIVVIDVGEGPIILINPEILETSGEQTGEEGCLSVPGKSGVVTRPDYVKVRSSWREKGCWRGPSAMRSITWTATCMWSWWKANSTTWARSRKKRRTRYR